MKRLMNSILIEGYCTDDAYGGQFNLEHTRDGAKMYYKIIAPEKLVSSCMKGKMLRIVGRLHYDSILAEHIEVI